MSQLSDAWKASPEQVEFFVLKTSIIPVIVLDSVVGELAVHLKDEEQVNLLYETLRNDENVGYIEGRSALVFENNPDFRKSMRTKDPRPFYYGFVRHCVAGLVKLHFPALFNKLPSSFSMGVAL